MNKSTSSANKASNKINPMNILLGSRIVGSGVLLLSFFLVSCSAPPVTSTGPANESYSPAQPTASNTPQTVVTRAKSKWVLASWSELPGLSTDNLKEAWAAWLQSCKRSNTQAKSVCAQVNSLANQDVQSQKDWLLKNFQPYRVESLTEQTTASSGLLTAYYEPVFEASRVSKPGFDVPLYGPPGNLKGKLPWYTRDEIAKNPSAIAALKGREIAFLADPVDAMILHIQGSGRLWITQADGSRQQIRIAFAATNEHPYQSIGRWLLDQNLTKDATWAGIKLWLSQNPKRTSELLSRNPRYVFFKEESLNQHEMQLGPKGAQGVPLTPGRSIAVDPGSIPYGTPVWISSSGPQTQLHRLVMAQDTGSAIVGAVRADYFVGSGPAAGELAGRLKQDLKMWVLLPR